MKVEKEVYIVFYGFMFILATFAFWSTLYNIHIKEKETFFEPHFKDAFEINIKDSRFYRNDVRKTFKLFNDSSFIIANNSNVYKKGSSTTLNSFSEIYPPYSLKKVENSDTIWIHRQFYGDTLFMKIDTIDENQQYDLFFKKLVEDKFSIKL